MLNMEHFVSARAAFCRDLAARRAERFSKPIRGPQFDHEAMLLADPDDPPAPPVVFYVVYQDAKGDLSGRNITLRTAKHEIGEVRLGALCHYRRAYRTFLASRVSEAIDLATGEVHEDGLDYFMKHPLLEGLSADHLANLSLETMAMQECRDEVILLSFVAAADEHFDENERDAIVRHVMNRVPEEGMSEAEIRRRVRCFAPDERAFHRALSRICAGEGDAKALMRTMRRVIEADGDYDFEEMAFADEIQRRLQEAGRLI
jgi:hypothetical protein